jgi:small subunit ribosomal protein S20
MHADVNSKTIIPWYIRQPLQQGNGKGIICATISQEVVLANLQSARKRIRSNARKRVRNQKIRSRARSAVRIAKAADKPEVKETAIRAAIRELDRAASKGVVHKNNAARRKSRLMRELRSVKKPAKKKG